MTGMDPDSEPGNVIETVEEDRRILPTPDSSQITQQPDHILTGISRICREINARYFRSFSCSVYYNPTASGKLVVRQCPQ